MTIFDLSYAVITASVGKTKQSIYTLELCINNFVNDHIPWPMFEIYDVVHKFDHFISG